MRIGHLLTAPLASCFAALTLVGTQGMTGRESAVVLLFIFPGLWGLVFGLAGAIPMTFNADARRHARSAFVAFGAGGAIAGAIIVALIATHNLGGSAAAVTVAFAIPFLLPWVLGVLIMRARRRATT